MTRSFPGAASSRIRLSVERSRDLAEARSIATTRALNGFAAEVRSGERATAPVRLD